ncbi:FecR family protein [Gimesia chilikensis]|uniref:FecR protein n=1 Tax=Gimesia chilikensis TaxID=2605989 RepID=A0A517PLE3_9PLAN|nr:FecR family protein [Gimesia chilikensis]QDT20194.1 FecR protein [Gimesia chilikensis]
MLEKDQRDDAEFQRLLHRLADGPLDQTETEQLESLLLDQPERQTQYLELMCLDASLMELGEISKSVPDYHISHPQEKKSVPWGVWMLTVCAVACLVVAVVLFVSTGNERRQIAQQKDPAVQEETNQTTNEQSPQEPFSKATLIAGHRAVFRGTRFPTLTGSRLRFAENYMLQDGMVKIRFASGAEVILKAPALFQVAQEEELVVNLGQCSVYAPEGAEGFKVSTPTSNVVDLGTRFSVTVAEDGASNVSVVDGEAEVSSLSDPRKKRLLKGETAYVGTDLNLMDGDRDQSSQDYIDAIPDHLIAYESIPDEQGRAKSLASVSVQRAGVQRIYQVDDFILPVVNHYRPGSHAFGVVPAEAPAEEFNRFGPMNLLFASGFINPGGEKEIHQGEFQLGRNGTPGMNLVFEQPVVNGPGPDMIIFDAQSIAHSLEGDVFHLYPQTNHPTARPMTVRKYDIDGHSEQAQIMTGCRLTQLSPDFADDGTPLPIVARSQLVHQVPSRLFAVGIDLDDMQIPPGGSITGLFLQDAQDDADRIDPVVIVGLPPR